MIISKTLKYVYIAIPRTGSKSMSRWLVDNFQGEWHGRHHEWKVPDECRDFLVFTLIRNPYEIQASGWFFEPVIRSGDEPPKPIVALAPRPRIKRTIDLREFARLDHHINSLVEDHVERRISAEAELVLEES